MERFELEGTLKSNLVPAPAMSRNTHSSISAQNPVQPDLGCLQGWVIHHLSVQPVPFSSMEVIPRSFFLLSPRCRHAAIAKYFGDVTPPCNKCCDYCKNPEAVKRQLEALERCSNNWSKTCIGPTGSSWDSYDPELYEGGRRGCGGFSRYDEESSGNGDEANEESRKREWDNFYKKQMSLRREGTGQAVLNWHPPCADCPLKDAFSRRISKLTVKGREHCLKILEEALSANQEVPTAVGKWSDPHACAVELEYEAFRTSKMANSYKAAVLKKVAEINKASKEGELFSVFGSGTGGSSSSVTKSESPAEEDFLPASQVYSFKPKRVGAGFPKKSGLFKTASELLKIQEDSDTKLVKKEDCPNKQDNSNCNLELDTKSTVFQKKKRATKAVCESAEVVVILPEKKEQQTSPDTKAALGDSPIKRTKPSKKQQMLAEAAKKESQDISKFFSLSKGGSKAKSCSSTEDVSCTASTLPQVSSQSICQEKSIPQENKDASGEDMTGQSQGENEELGETERTLTEREEDFKTQQAAESKLLQEELDVSSVAESVTETEQALVGEGQSGKRQGSDEDTESPATKRMRTAAKSSILSQPESKSVGLTKKKVTFDPNLLQSDKEGANKTIEPVTKSMSLKETADIVVKYLTPFYKGGKFASKDLFKGFARHLSHLLTEDQNPARKTVKEEAQRLIKEFFKTRVRCESETDWQELHCLEG
uniref:Uncharacterized protein n=1 Tax=Meleagris gallopavo TaxID=9103 RepID=G1N0A0_MELGA